MIQLLLIGIILITLLAAFVFVGAVIVAGEESYEMH